MKTLLIDFDGVLRISGKPAEGVQEFLDYLKNNGYKVCIISNSTHANAEGLQKFLKDKGINNPFPVMTAVDAAHSYAQKNYRTASVYVKENVKSMFGDIPDAEVPEAVIAGDLEEGWTFDILSEMFVKLYNGAELVAMQKNKFQETKNGTKIDAGAFIAGLEFASGKKAKLVGKPSKLYFESGLEAAGARPGEPFFMLGDDLTTDITGAQNAGGKGILIYTGKTSPEDLKTSDIQPDFEAENFDDVINLLKEQE